MKMNKKVSFDFDATLDREHIQNFAKELVDDGFEVWIVTSRKDNTVMMNPNWNDDLMEVAEDVGIPLEQIHWTNGLSKWFFFSSEDFIFHLDDDWIELNSIKNNVDGIVPISSFGNPNWKSDCLKAIADVLL